MAVTEPFRVFTASDHTPLVASTGTIGATKMDAPKETSRPSASAQRKRAPAASAPEQEFVGLPTHRFTVTMTFTKPLLGSANSNKQIYTDYIASKAPPGSDIEGELATLPTSPQSEDRPTVFHVVRDPQGVEHPILLPHVIRGFMKEAAKQLRDCGEPTLTSALTSYLKNITGLVFVTPHPLGDGWTDMEGRPVREAIVLNDASEITYNQRPLRAQTPQGTRIALTSSEEVRDAWIAFDVVCLGKKIGEQMLREWFTYGSLQGIGQWRSAGHGSFTFTLEAVD